MNASIATLLRRLALGCVGLAFLAAWPWLFPAPEDRHGGMFGLAAGVILLGAALYLGLAALATARGWWVRWLFLAIPLCGIAGLLLFEAVQVLLAV